METVPIEIVPIVVGLTQVVKDLGVPGRFLKLVAILIAVSLWYAELRYAVIFTGFASYLVWGVTATGLVSKTNEVAKSIAKKKE